MIIIVKHYYCLIQSVYILSKVKSLSHVWLFATPWTVAHRAPPSMEFSRQEYWSGLPFLLQGIFPSQGSNQGPALQADVLLSEPPGNLYIYIYLDLSKYLPVCLSPLFSLASQSYLFLLLRSFFFSDLRINFLLANVYHLCLTIVRFYR